MKLSVGSKMFDLFLSFALFLAFTELIFLQYMQTFLSSDPGAQCKHCLCPQYAVCVCLCVYFLLALVCVGCLFGLAAHMDSVNLQIFFILPSSLLSPPLHGCVCLYVCCLFHCNGDVYFWCMFALAPTPGPPDQWKLPGHSKWWAPLWRRPHWIKCIAP